MKTEVKLKLANPIEFSAWEEYGAFAVDLIRDSNKLVGLQVVIDHEDQAGRDYIVALARDKVIRILVLIQYASGRSIEIGSDETRAIEPASPVAVGLGYVKTDATLVQVVPLPPAAIVAGLSIEVTHQLGWYRSAQNSSWVVEKIRNYFEVLELETHVPSTSGGHYEPPAEMKWLRDAVSHPRIGNPDIATYLRSNIGSDHIDPNNESHLRFLESKVQIIQVEAQRILQNRVRKWW